MSSPRTIRRARSSDGGLRNGTLRIVRGVFLATTFLADAPARAVRRDVTVGRVFAALRALAALPARPTLPARPAFFVRATAPVFFRAVVFRAACLLDFERDERLVLRFGAARRERALLRVAAALRLAIAVVLSVRGYLDCFRVSVVKSSAYRRRK